MDDNKLADAAYEQHVKAQIGDIRLGGIVVFFTAIAVCVLFYYIVDMKNNPTSYKLPPAVSAAPQ